MEGGQLLLGLKEHQIPDPAGQRKLRNFDKHCRVVSGFLNWHHTKFGIHFKFRTLHRDEITEDSICSGFDLSCHNLCGVEFSVEA